MKLCITLISVHILSAFLATGQTPNAKLDDPIKRNLINDLFETTGVNNMMAQMLDAQLAKTRKDAPAAPESFWQEERKKMLNEWNDAFIQMYDKYLTVEDLQATITFYKTLAGQNYVRALPAIMQESSALGKALGTKQAERIIGKLRAHGYMR